MNRNTGLLLLAFALTTPARAAASEPPVLRMGTPPGGFPPYIIVDAKGGVSGLTVELFRQLAIESGFRAEFVEVPRKRSEDMTLQKQVDVMPRAREWTSQPERFLFTDSTFRVRDVVFTAAGSSFRYTEPTDLFGRLVGTHLGYSYPILDPHFKSGRITRDDSPHEKAMMVKLSLGFNEVAVINEMVGLWLIRAEGWHNRYAYSKTEVEGYEYRFMFRREHADAVARFNRALDRMKRDGRLSAMISRYKPEQAVLQR